MVPVHKTSNQTNKKHKTIRDFKKEGMSPEQTRAAVMNFAATPSYLCFDQQIHVTQLQLAVKDLQYVYSVEEIMQ